MSNSLAIAAVTSTLSRLLLNSKLLDESSAEDGLLTDLEVTTKPPDLARENTKNQLNLFLYQTTLNSAWRNFDPRQSKSGETGQPSLGLVLHYVITAYGKDNDDLLSHRLLGRAMHILHDHTILGAEEIKDALINNDLHQQIEKVRIVPQPISLEELSKLWTIFQAPYRISAAYEVSVVLIDSKKLAKAPLPVLTIGNPPEEPPSEPSGIIVQPYLPISFATLLDLKFPGQEPSAELGDIITLSGYHLLFENSTADNTTIELTFKHSLPATLQPSVDLINKTATEIKFKLPEDSNAEAVKNWPAGAYTVAATVTITIQKQDGTSKQKHQVSNDLPFLLAPKITLPSNSVVKVGDQATITITVKPEVWPEQQVFLLLGSLQIPAQPHSDKTDTLTFIIQPAPKGTFFIRLRVDGTDSHLIKLNTNNQPEFDKALQVNIS